MSPEQRMSFVLQLMALFAATLAVLAICAAVVASIAFRRAGSRSPDSFGLLAQRANLLQMLTVASVATSVLVLRLMELLDSAATVSVLSGIVGYVLGGLARQTPSPAESASK